MCEHWRNRPSKLPENILGDVYEAELPEDLYRPKYFDLAAVSITIDLTNLGSTNLE